MYTFHTITMAIIIYRYSKLYKLYRLYKLLKPHK